MSFLESYQQEQRKVDAERGPPNASLTVDLFATNAILAALLTPLAVLLGELPRNQDGSMQAIFVVPTFLLLSACAAISLRRHLLHQRAFRFVGWGVIGISALVIPAAIWAELWAG